MQGLQNARHIRSEEMASATPAVIFRAYDIRGIVNETLTTDIVYEIGRAFATEAKNKGCETVILARDGRKSSPALSDSMIQGIIRTGVNVLDIGLVHRCCISSPTTARVAVAP